MTVQKVKEDVCLEIPVAIHVDADMEPRVRRVLLLCFPALFCCASHVHAEAIFVLHMVCFVSEPVNRDSA